MTARSNQSKAVTTQLPLGLPNDGSMKDPASSENRSQPVHRWVPWVAGFSGQFVSDILERFLGDNGANRPMIIDPFCGVGTTLVEGLRRGIDSIGFEINPYAVLASRVKTGVMHMDLKALAEMISDYRRWMLNVEARVPTQGAIYLTTIVSRPPPKFKSRIPFFSDAILCQVLATQDFVSSLTDGPLRRTFLVAFGSVMVSFSNYSYEPSLGTRQASGKSPVDNAPVAEIVVAKLEQILEDASLMQDRHGPANGIPAVHTYQDSFFNARKYLSNASVDLVVTSPPYLNNYHYVRNTRPQLWWLGLVDDQAQLREMEHHSMGKFWQTVRDKEEVTLEVPVPGIQSVLYEVRHRNSERGAYGGPGWGNYVASYFNDLDRFAGLLGDLLRPGSRAVVVIGNSIIQGVEIEVDRLFSEISDRYGLTTESLDIIRDKRVGSSIVDSAVRTRGERRKVLLYDAAVTLRRS